MSLVLWIMHRAGNYSGNAWVFIFEKTKIKLIFPGIQIHKEMQRISAYKKFTFGEQRLVELEKEAMARPEAMT